MNPVDNEIIETVLLCDASGDLNPQACGWSRRPLHTCNLTGRFPRKKKWDYWCITSDRFLFSATIAHIDYLSIGAIYFLEYETKRFAEQASVRPFPRLPIMPEAVRGTTALKQRRLELLFQNAGEAMTLTAHSASFGGQSLDATFHIQRPETQENLNVVIPWSRNQFQFTSKQQCLPTQGHVIWGGDRFDFTSDDTFACLDYGRGIWPYRTVWNWGAFSGYSGTDVVGINMGAQWTDHTGMNENGILLNDRMHKISEDIVFEYDDRNFMKPWRMRTCESDVVQLEFKPFYEKAGNINLWLIRSKVNQVFGHYSGVLKVDDRTIPIDDLVGWAEEHRARW